MIKNYLALHMNKLHLISLLVVISSLAFLLAILDMQPPEPLSADSPKNLFSAERAIARLGNIATQPHSTGTEANRKVKDYLIRELRLAGLTPVVSQARMELKGKYYIVENIFAVKRGTSGKNGGKILLSAHYDARDPAPGASDNGYAVASILETLRALRYYPPLKNDLVILFPDGEELRSLGAKAFIRDDQIADSIDLVLNFDARGSSGISMMFETNGGNEWVVREFNKAHGSSFASSLSYEIYKLITNYTDFSHFLIKAHSGLNFANIGGVENYHNHTDDIKHLDHRTVQSTGNSMLSTVQHFGNTSLKDNRSGNAVFFHAFFPGLIIYPVYLALPILLMTLLLFSVVIISGYRNDKIRISKMLLSSLIFLAKIILSVVVVYFLWKWLGPMNPGFGEYEMDWVSNGDYFLSAFLIISLIMMLIFHGRISHRLGIFNVATGSLLVWLLPAIITSVFFPGASYLFIWPLLFTLLAIFIMMKKGETLKTNRMMLIMMFFAIPGIYLFTQVIYLFYLTMTLRLAWAIVAMFALLLGTLQAPLALRTYSHSPSGERGQGDDVRL